MPMADRIAGGFAGFCICPKRTLAMGSMPGGLQPSLGFECPVGEVAVKAQRHTEPRQLVERQGEANVQPGQTRALGDRHRRDQSQ
jgi:hypothetical protein